MATISELVAKHSKIPGDIRVRHRAWSDWEWFQPFYTLLRETFGPRQYRGGGYDKCHIYLCDEDEWELYTEPKKVKVRRAQYLIIPGTSSLLPFITDTMYKDEDECVYHETLPSSSIRNIYKVVRLLETEKEFEE